MRVSTSGKRYRLQRGNDGYLFVYVNDSSLPDGEIQVFTVTYENGNWIPNVVDHRWCSGFHPTNYARDLWDRAVAEGFTVVKSGMFISTNGAWVNDG